MSRVLSQSLDDVARRAGVSAATVSRALRGLSSVKPETRERIEIIARDMGYAVSPSASNLATGRTQTIGLLTPWVNRWFFSNIIEGAEKGLRTHGYNALLYTFHETPFEPRNRLDPHVLRRRVDGILVLGLQLEDDEVADIEQLGVPLIFLGPGNKRHTTVGIDDYRAARMVVDHFHECGHTLVGHVAGPDAQEFDNSPSAQRFAGWQDASVARGINIDGLWTVERSFDQESGRAAAHALLDKVPELTAIFAATDTLALGAMRAIKERGLVVGQDVAVAGIDDEEIAEYVGLTTVRQDPRSQGTHAAELLLAAIGGEELHDFYAGSIEFVERESSGRNSVRTLK